MGNSLTTSPQPRIYVACLAAYNNGYLHGAWIDAAQEPWSLYDEVKAVLAASPIAGAEEFAIHDYEGFGEVRIEEYTGLERVSELASFIAEHGEIGAALLDHFSGDLDEAREAMDDRYLGEHASLADYVQEQTEETTTIPPCAALLHRLPRHGARCRNERRPLHRQHCLRRGACVRGVLAMKEAIQHEPGDETAWICLCGNTPHTDGFVTCDPSGNDMEPTEDRWNGLYRCERCYRIIHQGDLKVIGIAPRRYRLTWRGIEIEASYTPRKWGVIAHLEVRSIVPEGAPLPITSTGYRSYFHQPGTVEAHGGDVVAQVIAWLDEEAAKPEWRDHVERSRQLSLF